MTYTVSGGALNNAQSNPTRPKSRTSTIYEKALWNVDEWDKLDQSIIGKVVGE